MICWSTDISKNFRESLGIRANESQLYVLQPFSCALEKQYSMHFCPFLSTPILIYFACIVCILTHIIWVSSEVPSEAIQINLTLLWNNYKNVLRISLYLNDIDTPMFRNSLSYELRGAVEKYPNFSCSCFSVCSYLHILHMHENYIVSSIIHFGLFF